ncbi:MAG TPA: DNA helicase, partial [Clostridiales bacterium]|nr:DNA helicase [Clostridiales bacterium]
MYDLKLEELVLGTLMSDRNAINEVRTLLTSNMFYSSYHQSLYLAMMEIDKRGERIDIMSVGTELRKTGEVDYYKLSVISESNTHDIYQHAAVIHDLYKRRSLLELSIRVQSDVKDLSLDIFDIVKDTSDALDGFFEVNEEGISTINDAINGVRDQMVKNASSTGEITGTPTGFKEFDKRSGGLQKSDLVIIAAESSQGKTSLAMTITLNAALRGSKVAVYSMEMKKEQIAARLMSIQSGVPANEILYSKLDHIKFDMIDRGIGTLYDKGIYFDDRSTSNIDNILNSIRSLKMKYDIDGVVVDYLQILNVNMKGASKE